jgi:UDP-N-acetylmuramoylalanine--D-glutamate ligase
MSGETIVVGLGKSNLSVVQYLLSKGTVPVVVDTREKPALLEKLPENVEFRSGSLDSFADLFAEAAMLITGPGIAVSSPSIASAADRGVEVVGDIELFVREAQAPVVAITGANGKSTVTTLVGLMGNEAGIKTAVGGNIGIPALDLLADPADLYVLELSSFQLETTKSLKAEACTILNITEDHMDRYDFDIEKYAAAKRIIYNNAKAIVFNRDDRRTFPSGNCEKTVSFGVDSRDYGIVESEDGTWLAKNGRKVLDVTQMKIVGRHNQLNALAAMALSDLAGIPESAQVSVLRKFSGLAHRCQFVSEINGVRYYNDSKATNVGSTIAAVDGLSAAVSGDIYLLAGGIGKGQNFEPVGQLLGRNVKKMFCFGRDAPILLKLGSAAEPAVDLEDALRKAFSEARSGDAVLLAPACASMDMFKNFEERGDVFTALVKKLEAENA